MPPNEDGTISPLINTIVTTLSGRIHAGQYSDRKGFPSERELVAEFGVSRTIIRRVLEVLEQQALVVRSERCRTVVRNPATVAPSRKGTRRCSVGLWIWPNSTDPATSCVAQGICRTLDQSRYRLIIGNVVWDSWESVCRSEARFLEHMAEDEDIVGVLLWYLGGKENLPALRKLRAANVPIIFMDRQPPEGFEADYVGVDNEQAAEAAVTHLITQGHRRIAHISNEDNATTVTERMTGYRRALQNAGLPFDPELVAAAWEASRAEAPAVHGEIVERLLSLSDPPTAAFGVNDVIAERFMASIRARGLRIPEDMAVVGFDGSERWWTTEPFLTTIQQPFELLGIHAARLLLQRIESGPATAFRHILLEAPLCIYGSTRFTRRDSNLSRSLSRKEQ